jgi:hypothetical protein
MHRNGIGIAAAVFGITIGFAMSVGPVYAAAKKVDCDAVMQELGSGKKAKEVATDQKISTSSVYRCKSKQKAAAKAAAKAGNEVASKPAASPATIAKP